MDENLKLKQIVSDLEEKCQYQDIQIVRLMSEIKDTYSSNQHLTEQILNLDSIINQLIIENQQLKNDNNQAHYFIEQTQKKINFNTIYAESQNNNNEIFKMINEKQKQVQELKNQKQKDECKMVLQNKLAKDLMEEILEDKIYNLQMDITILQQMLPS